MLLYLKTEIGRGNGNLTVKKRHKSPYIAIMREIHDFIYKN